MSAQVIDSLKTGASSAANESERIRRFTRTERAVHWVQATGFLALLISGFILALPALEAIFGHRDLWREVHLSSAIVFAFGPTIVALAGDRSSLAQDIEAVDTWDADDLRWLIPFPLLRALGIATPPQGRFNAGQKLNAIFVAWSTLAFVITGLLMWQNRRFPTDLVSQANTVHTTLAYIALAAFLGHLYLATTYRATRHAFRAITQGWVSRSWAEHHHPKWAHMAHAPQPAPPLDALRTGLQIVLGSAAALFLLRAYFFWLGANTTDKVTGWLYALTAWPGTASVTPKTATNIVDYPALVYLGATVILWLAVDRLRHTAPRATPG